MEDEIVDPYKIHKLYVSQDGFLVIPYSVYDFAGVCEEFPKYCQIEYRNKNNFYYLKKCRMLGNLWEDNAIYAECDLRYVKSLNVALYNVKIVECMLPEHFTGWHLEDDSVIVKHGMEW